jgi:threonyl-tRNA synthetase
MIKISFPDGAIREYESGVSSIDVAKSISEGLARNVLAAYSVPIPPCANRPTP